MLRSMTGFGSAEKHLAQGTLTVDIRSVNNRFLDIQYRLPDIFRALEPQIRSILQQHFQRGKIEVRVHLRTEHARNLQPEALEALQQYLTTIQATFPHTPSPTFREIIEWSESYAPPNTGLWTDSCLAAVQEACAHLIAHSQREGEHLCAAMRTAVESMETTIQEVEACLPDILQQYQRKLAQKLQDTMQQAFPQGFQHITHEALFERIQQETALFSIRIDIREEITRLRAHIQELLRLFNTPKGAIGKRIDFLLQELQREANTLGSKSADIRTTEASIALKIAIEQIREQIQNIE